MSNPVHYDPRLVAALAEELRQELTGRMIRALRLDPERHLAALEFATATLVLDLHPTRGWIVLAPAAPVAPRVVALRKTRLIDVAAPADERILRLDFAGPPHGRLRRLMIELMTNQENVLALDDERRILTALRRRSRGRRPLEPGMSYTPPPTPNRAGAAAPIPFEAWSALLDVSTPTARRRAVLRAVAWTSALNVDAILAAPRLRESYARYLAACWPDRVRPCLLEPDGARQPYAVPLPGVPSAPFPSVLDAMAARAAGMETGTPSVGIGPALLERLRHRLRGAGRRIRHLEAEAAGARPEADGLREKADLLLAHLGDVQKGASVVELEGFDGTPVRVEMDPSLAPAENARRLYDAARRRERAAERVPKLLRAAREQRDALADLIARAERGEADAAEVGEAAGEPAEGRRGSAEPRPLPYLRYATSGGLEVRVGRNRRANDDLTFHHSSPNDIWLHARDTAGAHVVLRWDDAEGNPPRQDLEQAAVLAALHSRARTSGTVPVDWTRRKYVRKPRKAAPGSVAIERARTVFVEPDAALEERLRKA